MNLVNFQFPISYIAFCVLNNVCLDTTMIVVAILEEILQVGI